MKPIMIGMLLSLVSTVTAQSLEKVLSLTVAKDSPTLVLWAHPAYSTEFKKMIDSRDYTPDSIDFSNHVVRVDIYKPGQYKDSVGKITLRDAGTRMVIPFFVEQNRFLLHGLNIIRSNGDKVAYLECIAKNNAILCWVGTMSRNEVLRRSKKEWVQVITYSR